MSKSVVILGTGLTLSKFKKEEHNGSEIWSVGSAYSMLKESDIVTTYFCLHTDEHIDFDGEIIDQTNYPLKEIIEKYKSSFFTNTISYMIAYAILKKYTSIKIYGVDMDAGGEYSFERPSVTYWIGYARGLSIEVEISSEIDKPLFLYGFDNVSNLIKRLEDRRDMSYQMAQKCYGAGDTDRGHQYLGQYYDNTHWLRELKG